ncbi:MAG TPA: Dabb family protein [Planctomycetota bacterium]|nr:Dabb family protein [Planctomycetota bacterium]
MIVHTVFFWMKKGAPKDAAKRTIHDAIKYLKTPTVRHLWAGPPAKTPPRDVVNSTYDVGLTVIFDDVQAHDAYQDDPQHQVFIKRNKKNWLRVEVYDAEASGS